MATRLVPRSLHQLGDGIDIATGVYEQQVVVTGAFHEFRRHIARCQELGGCQRNLDWDQVVRQPMDDQAGHRDRRELRLVGGDEPIKLRAGMQSQAADEPRYIAGAALQYQTAIAGNPRCHFERRVGPEAAPHHETGTIESGQVK